MSPMKRPAPADKVLENTLSLTQVSRRLEISRACLRRILGTEELDFVEIRGRIRVPADALRRYESTQAKQPRR
ncbi:MAG: hypothetical protein JW888_09070 [Pirellulales bacterium]|nr:hypothetical protein [Pirellulales bacterium]